jgi:porin
VIVDQARQHEAPRRIHDVAAPGGGDTTDGASGFYCTVDQTLIRENPDDKEDPQGLGSFFIYDHAQESVIEVNNHISGGLAYTGLFPKRDEDVLGIGATWVHFSDGGDFAHNSETTVEAFYKLQITPWFAVQPDLQYVIDPGFATRNALVGTLRMKLEF